MCLYIGLQRAPRARAAANPNIVPLAAPHPRLVPPYANPRGGLAGAEISNRHTLRLEIVVNPSKQPSAFISNRHKSALVFAASPTPNRVASPMYHRRSGWLPCPPAFPRAPGLPSLLLRELCVLVFDFGPAIGIRTRYRNSFTGIRNERKPEKTIARRKSHRHAIVD